MELLLDSNYQGSKFSWFFQSLALEDSVELRLSKESLDWLDSLRSLKQGSDFLKLSFTNIWGLDLNFFDCESFLESNSPDILHLCETNLDGSIDCANFFVKGYLPLIQKDSSTQMYGLAVYVKEGLPFAWDLSLKNSADSYLTSFSSIDHLLCLCA